LKDAALEYGSSFPLMWQTLPEALQQNGHWEKPDIFGEVADNPERLKTHHRMLRSYALHDFTSIPSALGLNGNEHVVDAGGGFGALALLLLDAFPELRVTVLDLPEVIEYAKKQCSGSGRLKWCPLDFFKPWNLQANVVLLTRILHDWNDQGAIQILRRARESLSSGGKIFVVEMLLSPESMNGSLCDLHLLMATGGQERTEDEYSSLFKAAGFSLSTVKRLPALPSILMGVAQ
jgi:trans-aconitate methyltransferase